MIVAFTDLGSRTDALHASLLVSGAIRASGASVSHIRVLTPASEPAMPAVAGVRTHMLVDAVHVVREARRNDHDVVLNVPHAARSDPALRRLVDALVVTVGPHADDEREAAGPDPFACHDGAPPAWYLGCRRSGGQPAASRFAARMSDLGRPNRLIPGTLPVLSRLEGEDLGTGVIGARLLAVSRALVSTLRRIAADPSLGTIGSGDGFSNDAARDSRSFPERLRELADDLETLDRGKRPTADILADAPVLEGWAVGTVPVPVLRGVASGHPSIATGRPVVTTQVMATDNATWARTLSRYYVLGSAAGERPPAHLLQ